MILDSEAQKNLLLTILPTVPINGMFTAAKDAVVMIDRLITAVQEAEIKESQAAEQTKTQPKQGFGVAVTDSAKAV